MKILYVDLKYDYGIKSRGLNFIGQSGFKQNFEKLGHEVDTFYYDDYLNNQSAIHQLILSKADSFKPDLIFFILFEDQFDIQTLETLKNKYTTMSWFGDDTWRFDNFTYRYAKSFTYSVTTDKFSISKYKKLGVKNIIASQWAAIDNSFEVNLKTNYEYDISFVGGFHTYRSWFIKFLEKQGIKVHCFGHGWDNGSVNSEEMNNIFLKSKINLNLSNSTSYDLRYLTSSLKGTLQTIRGKKAQSQIKARNFEINYYGGFQIADFVPCLEDYYQIGKEIVCYKNIDELPLLINYYLNNDSERENIKTTGYQRARREHGYLNRLRTVLSELNK